MTISESPVLASTYGDRSVSDLVEAVANLLGGQRPGRLPAFDHTSRIALVRGFDRVSRSLRAALGEVAREYAGGLVDVAPIPSFGQISEASDVSLVVVTRDSLVSGAQRCAAQWGALMVTADELATEQALAEQHAATLAVRREGTSDVATERLSFTDRVTVDGTPRVSIQLMPAQGGVYLDDAEQPVAGPVVVETHGQTMGSIDGEPQLFAEGRYEVSVGGPLRRIVTAA